MHRIPYGRNDQPPGPEDHARPTVFMGHCLLGSSAVWTFGPPEKSLGFVLADAGTYSYSGMGWVCHRGGEDKALEWETFLHKVNLKIKIMIILCSNIFVVSLSQSRNFVETQPWMESKLYCTFGHTKCPSSVNGDRLLCCGRFHPNMKIMNHDLNFHVWVFKFVAKTVLISCRRMF